MLQLHMVQNLDDIKCIRCTGSKGAVDECPRFVLLVK